MIEPAQRYNQEGAEAARPERKGRTLFPFILIVCIALALYGAHEITMPSADFQPNTLVDIPEGEGLSNIGKLLAKNNIVRSPVLFSLLVTHSGKEKRIASGMYLFKNPEDVFTVAARIASGDRGIETKRITLPEGLTTLEMSKTLARVLPNFDAPEFLTLAGGKEGYLFPDTYFFLSTATSGEVESALSENFNKKTAKLHDEATATAKDWGEIVTMASIIEGEAVTPEDRRIVSGILWKRLHSGMRLGVDAPFAYIMGKGSNELTTTDLATSSPYNTYRVAGLPPTPIDNPGEDAILAALEPSTTPYLFYLSDASGVMHYAKTFEEHKLNKERYLR